MDLHTNDRSEDKHLAIYLDDHWAGAGAGADLARSLAAHNRDSPWGGELGEIADEIAADEQTLADLRDALGVSGGTVKRIIAKVAERARAVAKLNGQFLGYSPLSRLVEVEALMVGVAGKQRLWAALGAVPISSRNGIDLTELDQRAQNQLARLAAFHEWAASVAFASERRDADQPRSNALHMPPTQGASDAREEGPRAERHG